MTVTVSTTDADVPRGTPARLSAAQKQEAAMSLRAMLNEHGGPDCLKLLLAWLENQPPPKPRKPRKPKVPEFTPTAELLGLGLVNPSAALEVPPQGPLPEKTIDPISLAEVPPAELPPPPAELEPPPGPVMEPKTGGGGGEFLEPLPAPVVELPPPPEPLPDIEIPPGNYAVIKNGDVTILL